jgi:DNA-binding response OmpR family regulator
MLIDDDPSVTEMLKLNLEQIGKYCVCVENDPREALGTARLFRPDLILLDVMMPGMDGGDVASWLASDSQIREVPIIFLTALVSQEESPSGGLLNRQHRMLPKGMGIDQLIEQIEATMAEAAGGRV